MESPKSLLSRCYHQSDFRIAGVASCTPSEVVPNSAFVESFGEAGIREVAKLIGVEERRWVADGTSTADLAIVATKKLMQGLDWDPVTIDAIVFCSQTPNWRLPATACWMQSALGLDTRTVAFDVNLGCSGYPYALWLGSCFLQPNKMKRVILVVGDTISKIIDPNDRATALLFGDAATATALEYSPGAAAATFILGTDGKGWDNLVVAEGAFKDSSESLGGRLGNKSPNRLFMDGGEIFNFTLRSVPSLVAEMLQATASEVADYDAFLFHQANLFMLKHLAKKCGIPPDKFPLNIQQYGNTSSASIPLLMATRLKDRLKMLPSMRLMMCGFGVGYSWGAAAVKVDASTYVEHMNYESRV